MSTHRKQKSGTTLKVPLMKNAFMDEKLARKALSEFVLTAPRLSMGEKCMEFERAFAKKQGRKHAILFSSGSTANMAMIQALKNLGHVKTGDKIGFSALTWATNVMPILQLGLGAIPIDVNTRTLNSHSTQAIPTLEKEKCKVFFITNVLGFTGDLDVIERECRKRNIIVLEDNCGSLGTELRTGKAGNFSLAASFSFYVAHHMSTIEGGMVCTNDGEFAEMLRMIRSNGWDRNLGQSRQNHWRKKHGVKSEFHSKYTFYDLAYNFRPTEIVGFLGLHQLLLVDKAMKTREENFRRVQESVAENDHFVPVDFSHIKTVPAFALPFVCTTERYRDRYVKIFNNAGVEVRPLIAGNMQQQPFYGKYHKRSFRLPGADFLHSNAFYCGNCPDYTETEIRIILDCVRKDSVR